MCDRHRVLRHRAVVNTVESLSVRALAMRQTGSMLRSAGQELNTCYIFCELENLSQVSFCPYPLDSVVVRNKYPDRR